MLCSFSLQLIFFSEQPFYGNYSTLDSHTNTVIFYMFAYSSRWRRRARRSAKLLSKQVQSFCNVIREKGNPSLYQIRNFLLLDTRDIMDATIVKTVRTVKELSNKQFQEFCTTKLNQQ